VILDAAHNPHGARATAAALSEAFDFSPLIGVLAIMKDKDASGLLEAYQELFTSVVVTQVASTDRGMPAADLGVLAAGILGADRVQVVPRMDDAIEVAIGLAEVDGATAPGVVITGSVIAVGEARTLLVGREGKLDPPAARVTGDGVLDASGAPVIDESVEEEGEEKDYSYGPEYGEFEPDDEGAYGPLAEDQDSGDNADEDERR
jgi:dihydrofolate synthase/folylpolyglutamate synthase